MRIDPMTEDPRDLEDREDEMRRELRWAEFERDIRAYKQGIKWSTVLSAVADALDAYPGDAFMQQCIAFAETEDWSGVVTAIGRAMKDDEQARRELMDRR